MEQQDAASGVVLDEAELETLVRTFGRALSNAFMYGIKHDVTVKSIGETHTLFVALFARVEELSFLVSEESLYINRLGVPLRNPLVRMFVTKVLTMGVSNLTLDRSMTREQLGNLVEILNATSEQIKQLGGFVAFSARVGLTCLKVRNVRYQEVAEDETVVAKDAAAEAGSAESSAPAATGGEAASELPPPAPGPKIENIVAFLKGSVELSGDIVQGVQDTACDAQKLGELILQTAQVGVEQANLDGAETLAGLVVGCLRRTYQAMKKDPAANTQKGKKALSKQLLLLEEEVVNKMRAMGEAVAAEELASVQDACEEILDEIKIEALATEYMKKRSQIDANERRILRFMRGKSAEELEQNELKELLVAGGMTPDGWEELVVRSGAGGRGGSGPAGGPEVGIAALGQLASLLTRMEETIRAVKEPGTPESVQETVREVRQEVEALVEHTRGQIQTLVGKVRDDAEQSEAYEVEARRLGHGPAMSRKELLATLAEICQELCQPLAVINCSLGMIRNGVLGTVSQAQTEMLDLATESSDKLQVLTRALQDIAGLPETMTPDSALQSSLYGGA